jgi:hypothetical protein
MKNIACYYFLFIVAFVFSVRVLPASWPIVDKIQQKMPQNIVVLFSYKDVWRNYQSDPGKIKYLVVGECNAWNFPGDVPRLALGNTGGLEELKQIEKMIRIATFFNAENVAVFWGIANAGAGDSREAVEAQIGKLVEIVEETYPTAEILVVSPYDVIAVNQSDPAHRRDDFHLSDPAGYAELIKRIPELENFVKGDERNLYVKDKSLKTGT